MEEKKSNGLLVVVALLCLLVGGVGGYFVSTNFMNKGNNQDKSSDKKEDNNVIVYSTSDPKVSKLIDNLIYDSTEFSCGQNNIWYYTKDISIKATDIASEKAFYMVVEYEDLNKDGKITYDEIEKSIQKILGKDYKFDSTKDITACNSRGYNSKTKTLVPAKSEQCGGACDPMIADPSYKIVKAVDTNGILEMELKVVFENEDKKIYSDYEKKNLIANYNDEYDEFSDSNSKVLKIDEVFNKGSDYKFTFKLEDGNYVFVSSEPLK